jgi:redox-sensitive bicupin YhaK (pirin superfamily)
LSRIAAFGANRGEGLQSALGVDRRERPLPDVRQGVLRRSAVFPNRTFELPTKTSARREKFAVGTEPLAAVSHQGSARSVSASGRARAVRSPCPPESSAAARCDQGAALPDDREDRGLYVTGGSIDVAGDVFEAGQMMVFRPGDKITVKAGPAGARLMALGGETLNGPRHIWWNFVASLQDKIEAAKVAWAAGDWAHGRFQLPPDDNDEFVPLP